jgi:hypothetical protein
MDIRQMGDGPAMEDPDKIRIADGYMVHMDPERFQITVEKNSRGAQDPHQHPLFHDILLPCTLPRS